MFKVNSPKLTSRFKILSLFDLLKIELENSNKNESQFVEPLETLEVEDLRAELAKMKEEREEEKKELQSLYDQLSSALAGSGETV